jgi:hypothetical protein
VLVWGLVVWRAGGAREGLERVGLTERLHLSIIACGVAFQQGRFCRRGLCQEEGVVDRAEAVTVTQLSCATSTSVQRRLATAFEKPALQKIYRWVSPTNPFQPDLTCPKNPDEPATKPHLQSYSIDLNQTGPMINPTHPPIDPI